MISRIYYSIIDNRRAVLHWVLPLVVLAVAGVMVARALSQDEIDGEESKTLTGKVKRVYSGHTVKMKHDDDRLRLAGIRAPYKDEPYYQESRDQLGSFVIDQRIRLRFDKNERDRKGRLVGYVFLKGLFVNAEMVRQGLAYVRLTPDTRRYADELLKAQAEAKRKKRGVWSQVQWDTADSFPADPKYGNFHLPLCEEVDKINPSRLVLYKNKRKAFKDGLAPCTKCQP